MDAGDLNTAFDVVDTYGSSLTFTALATDASDPMIAGKIYTFRFKATNIIGDSAYSEYLRVGLGDQVAKPTNLAFDESQTGSTYIHLTWDQVADDDLPTLGYILQMLEGTSYKTIYDASNNPDAMSFTKFGLTAGQ